MKPITPDQLKCISTIVSVARIDKERKADMVAGFSNGRCTSSKDLHHDEALLMIKHLQELSPPIPDKGSKMRRHIIAMAHEMGWQLGNKKADMPRINGWCEKQFGKKKLNAYTYSELPRLVHAMQQVYKHFLNAV